MGLVELARAMLLVSSPARSVLSCSQCALLLALSSAVRTLLCCSIPCVSRFVRQVRERRAMEHAKSVTRKLQVPCGLTERERERG